MYCPLRYRPLAAATIALIAGTALGWALPLFSALCGAVLTGVLAFVLVWRLPKEKRARNLKRLLIVILSLLIGIGLMHTRTLYFNSAQTIEGTLTGKIVRINTANTGKYLLLDNAIVDNKTVTGKVLLFISNEKEKKPFQYGELVSAKEAKLKPPKAPTNPGGTDKRITLWSLGARYSASAQIVVNQGGDGGLIRALFAFRTSLEQTLKKLMSEDAFGAVRGMLFGDVSTMEEDWLDAFRKTGIAHVLAVSGMNVGIIAAVAMWLFKIVRLGRWSGIVTIGLLAAYCIMAGLSVSVLRATFMTILLLIIKRYGERADATSLLCGAAAAQVLFNPFVLFTPSFLLSYGAVLGIVLLYAPINAFLNSGKLGKSKVYKMISGAVSVSAAAQLGTMPAQIAFFNALPLLSIPINLIVIPLVFVVTIGGLVAALLGSTYLPLGVPFAFITEWAAKIMFWSSQMVSRVPFSTVIIGDLHPLLYASIVLLCGAAALSNKERRRAMLLCLILSALLFVGGSIPMLLAQRGAELTMLDVGEGDALFLRAGNQSIMLDGGRLDDYHDDGKSVVLPFLRSRGISALDAVIVSHPHADHCGGLVAVIEAMKVKRLYIGSSLGADQPFELLVNAAKRRGVKIIFLKKGDEIVFGELDIMSIAPAQYTKNANESSLVLLMQYGSIKALLAGDSDGAGEENYSGAVSGADILKVAHHGSKYGTGQELLRRVRPAIALISVGAGNSYGHPAQETLKRLQQAGARVYRTDRSGAITIKIQKDRVEVVPFLQ